MANYFTVREERQRAVTRRNEHQGVIDRLDKIADCPEEMFIESLSWALFGDTSASSAYRDITLRIIELIDSRCNEGAVYRLDSVIDCPPFTYGIRLYEALFGHPIEGEVTCGDFSRRIAELIGDATQEIVVPEPDPEPGPCPRCGEPPHNYIGGILCDKCGFHVTRHLRTNAETIRAWNEGEGDE